MSEQADYREEAISQRKFTGDATMQEKAPAEVLNRLDNELDRYTRNLAMLENVLTPVLTGPSNNDTAPREAPYNMLHENVLRLEAINDAFEMLRSRIKL